MSKEKGKAHPFAGYLDPNEEVLWMITTPTPSLWESVAKTFRVYFILCWICMIIITLSLIPVSGQFSMGTVIFVFFLMACGAVPYVGAELPHAWSAAQYPFEYAYAITNKQLLYRHLSDVWCLPLREIVNVKLTSSRYGGTLSFDNHFPKWAHLEDAVSVKQIIEQAVEDRSYKAKRA